MPDARQLLLVIYAGTDPKTARAIFASSDPHVLAAVQEAMAACFVRAQPVEGEGTLPARMLALVPEAEV